MRDWLIVRRTFWRGVPLGIACAVITWLLSLSESYRGLDEWLLDGLFFQRGVRPTTANVILVGLDDDSLKEFGKPLAYLSPELAQVVGKIREQGAKAVGIDLMVPEDMSELPDIATPGAIGDARSLGQTIFDVGNVVLPKWIVNDETSIEPLLQWRFKSLLDDVPDPTDVAFVNNTEDPDQFVRRQQLLVQSRGQAVPHFILAMLSKGENAPIEWDDENHRITIGSRVIPLEDDQRVRLNYVGPPGTFPVVPFRDVLHAARDGVEMPMFRDAYVIIGVTSRGLQDYHSTPYSNQYALSTPSQVAGLMNGSEIHLHLLATLLDGAYLTTPRWLATLPLLLVCGVLLSAALARLGIEWGLLLALAYYFGWKALALVMFREFGWHFSLVSVLRVGMIVYVVAVTLRWRLLRRILRAVKSQPIAKAFEADPRQLTLGGENRCVTVLFADVRSFTSFSERHHAEPVKVVALLNAYFTKIVPVIEAHGGTLNQYMGDGIMVIFNAPENQPDHALRAARAAAAMIRIVQANQALWTKHGYEGMRIGVGINTGMAVVGAVGAPSRLDYSAIGDTTNTAARIEAENKHHGTSVLISEQTLLAIPPAEYAALGLQADVPIIPTGLKGKTAVPRLYEVRVEGVSAGGRVG